MNVNKMDHAMLSFGLNGGLLVSKASPKAPGGLLRWLARLLQPR